MKYLGIDFGTVWTKAAIYDTDTSDFRLIDFDNDSIERADFELLGGKDSCPSAIYYQRNGKIRYGKEAARSRMENPEQFHQFFKTRLDKENVEGEAAVNHSKLFLKYIYEKALSQNLNEPFSKVVVTVPSSTLEGDTRWSRMCDILHDIGITNYELIKEPEAAGYYVLTKYIRENQDNNHHRVLIYDLGGGTFDPAIIERNNGSFRIIGEWDFNTGRDIGGIYIDNLIRENITTTVDVFREDVNDFLSSLPTDQSGRVVIDTSDRSLVSRYRMAITYRDKLNELSISAKHFFSDTDKDEYEKYDSLYSYSLTRTDFYNIIQLLVEESIACCEDLVSKYGTWKDITDVVLIGGSSVIPLIKSKFEDKKKDNNANFTIHSSGKDNVSYDAIHSVAIGAAMYESLQPSYEQRVKYGRDALTREEYAEAEFQFEKAHSDFWRAIMYYKGLGPKQNYRETINICKNAMSVKDNLLVTDYIKSFILYNYMLFQGQGVKKNNELVAQNIKALLDGPLGIDLQKGIPWLYDDCQLLYNASLGLLTSKEYDILYSTDFVLLDKPEGYVGNEEKQNLLEAAMNKVYKTGEELIIRGITKQVDRISHIFDTITDIYDNIFGI